MRTWKILSLLLIAALAAGTACNDDDDHGDRDGDHHQMNGHDEHEHSSADNGDSAPSARMKGRWADAAVGDRVRMRIRGGEDQPSAQYTLTVEEIHRDKIVLKRSLSANVPEVPALPGGAAAPDLSEMTSSTYEVPRAANPWENLPGEMPSPGQVPAKTGTQTLTIDGKSVSTTVYEADTPSISKVKY